jgi:hypothetical protein
MNRKARAAIHLEKTKRHYHYWVVNETLEDYFLRYVLKPFCKRSELDNSAL